MNNFENLPNLVESILFGAGRPIRLSEIKTLMGSQNIEVDLPSIKVALNSLEERYADSSMKLKKLLQVLECKLERVLVIAFIPYGMTHLADFLKH